MNSKAQNDNNHPKVIAGIAITKDSFSLEEIHDYHHLLFEQAKHYLETLATVYGVNAQITEQIGAYKGTIEPSFTIEFNNTELQTTQGLLAEWAKCFDQDSVRIIFYDNTSKDFRSEFVFSEIISHNDSRIISFINDVERLKLSASIMYHNNSSVKGVEYWGKNNEHDRAENSEILLLLEKHFSSNSFTKNYIDHYKVLDIPEEGLNYDDYIRVTNPGRESEVIRGECIEST